MQIYSQLVPLALGNANGSAVAMGFFDGIHIGHRAVIEGAVQWARAHGASPAVFTFKLPTENKMKGKRLLSTEDKHALIERLGVEHYLCPDFEEIKAMTPEQFVLGIVRDCNAKALFCGENFTFGAKAAGNPELLRKLCAPLGVEVVVLPMARFEEKPVSSTRIRAALEGIAYQTLDIVGAMQRDAGVSLVELKVDGGAARNDLLMQFQADLLATKVIRPRVTETTALGAAYLAGLAVGYWESVGEIRKQWQAEHIFEPAADRTQIANAVAGWEDAVRRVLREKND